MSGSGTVGAMDGVMVVPSMRGDDTFVISTLTGSYWTGAAAGFGVTDAAGDPGVGYDQLRITGDVDIPAVVDGEGRPHGGAHVGRRDRSSRGRAPTSIRPRSYRWPVVHVDGQVNGFDPAAVSVMVVRRRSPTTSRAARSASS